MPDKHPLIKYLRFKLGISKFIRVELKILKEKRTNKQNRRKKEGVAYWENTK
ncbi:hypothetical protein NUSPORA_00710 [Nucleospora cyclopteri]